MNRNGNSANFFSYVCNSKKIKELFASTLNGMTASVRCVSSIIVVLNVKLTRTEQKRWLEMKKPDKSAVFAS